MTTQYSYRIRDSKWCYIRLNNTYNPSYGLTDVRMLQEWYKNLRSNRGVSLPLRKVGTVLYVNGVSYFRIASVFYLSFITYNMFYGMSFTRIDATLVERY